MRLFKLISLSFVILLLFLAEAYAEAAEKQASNADTQVTAPKIDLTGLELLGETTGWKLTESGEVQFDETKWSVDKNKPGQDIFTLKSANLKEQQVAIKDRPYPKNPKKTLLQEKRLVFREDNDIRYISHVSVKPSQNKKRREDQEDSRFVLFLEGKVASVTTCDDQNEKIQRECTTVTRPICGYVKEMIYRTQENDRRSGQPIPPGPILVVPPKEMLLEGEKFEVKAVSTILMLRGADHQLDNLVRTGSLTGVKSAHQTTRGRITGDNPDVGTLTKMRHLCEMAAFATAEYSDQKTAQGISSEAAGIISKSPM